MAAVVLDFRDERHHLPGSGEHFHQRRGSRRRVPFQRRPARRGAQRLPVGLRDFSGSRRETCRPVRSEARADRGALWWGAFTALTALIPLRAAAAVVVSRRTAVLTAGLILFVGVRFMLGAGEA